MDSSAGAGERVVSAAALQRVVADVAEDVGVDGRVVDDFVVAGAAHDVDPLDLTCVVERIRRR